NVIDREIGQGRTATPMERRSYTPWLSVAAALLLAGAVAYLLMPVQKEAGSGVEETIAAPIVPGKNQATLVLEDGAVIPLSSHQEGIFVHANGIRYLDGTALAGKTGSTSRHTITTPKGGQYQVILPDGSRVWLNAASTLIYPVVFDDNRREVELIGEALFDIEPGTGTSAGKPVAVTTPQQQIDVLGTSFVVSVYPDEPEPR